MEQTTDTRGIVDTDILIDGQRRRDDAPRFSGATAACGGPGDQRDLCHGAGVKGCRNALALARVEQFLRVVRVLPIHWDSIPGRLSSRCSGAYVSHGLLIPDALIAATLALDYGVALYTKNVRHFPDDPRSDGGAPLLKAVHSGRFLLLSGLHPPSPFTPTLHLRQAALC